MSDCKTFILQEHDKKNPAKSTAEALTSLQTASMPVSQLASASLLPSKISRPSVKTKQHLRTLRCGKIEEECSSSANLFGQCRLEGDLP